MVHPAKDGGEDEALPVFQLDEPPFARPLALDVGQQLNELARPRSTLGVEHIRPVIGQRTLQILRLALHGQLGPLAGGHSSAGHRIHIALGGFNVAVVHVGYCTKLLPPSPTAKAAKPDGGRLGSSMPGSVGCT